MNRTLKTLALAALAAVAFQAQAAPARAADAKKKQNFTSLINVQDNFTTATTTANRSGAAASGSIQARSFNPYDIAYLNRQFYKILARNLITAERLITGNRLANIRYGYRSGQLSFQQFVVDRTAALNHQLAFNTSVQNSLAAALGQLRVNPTVLAGTQLRSIGY